MLKSGRDKSVRNRHPRLFSGAIKEISGKPKDGEIVDIADNKGEWLARGVLNRLSATAVRILTWDAAEAIDDAFYFNRVKRAVERRDRDPNLAHTNARRIVFAESDGLPGLVADDYAGHIVAEYSALCSVQQREVLSAALREAGRATRVIERFDDERLRTGIWQQRPAGPGAQNRADNRPDRGRDHRSPPAFSSQSGRQPEDRLLS